MLSTTIEVLYELFKKTSDKYFISDKARSKDNKLINNKDCLRFPKLITNVCAL